MAEQNRSPNNPIQGGASRPRMDFHSLTQGSGAEVDRHGSHFSIDPENAVNAISSKFSNVTKASSRATAAEQDRYGSHFSFVLLPAASI